MREKWKKLNPHKSAAEISRESRQFFRRSKASQPAQLSTGDYNDIYFQLANNNFLINKYNNNNETKFAHLLIICIIFKSASQELLQARFKAHHIATTVFLMYSLQECN